MVINSPTYKTVLVVSRGFRAGDAITTLNLFSKWPKDKLFVTSLVGSEYTDRLEHFYLLGDKEVNYRFPFNKISRPVPSQEDYNYVSAKANTHNQSALGRLYQTIGRPMLQWLDMYETRLSIDISDEFDYWLKKINPDIIYTSVGDIAMAEFLIKLHNKYPNIKFVIHGFDDWLSPTYKIWNGKFHRRKAEKLFQKILAFSSARFTSSELMANEYSNRYCYDFVCYPNPVKIPESNLENIKKSPIINIVFTGKVGWHNHYAIKDMMTAVERLAASWNIIRFDIYTDSSKSQLESFLGRIPDSTIIHKPVPNSQIPEVLAAAHILYLPINIDRQTAKFTKYSMSTKMGEYLTSGVPVIYYGPEGIAMTEFLKKNNCTTIITIKGIDNISENIKSSLLGYDEMKLRKAKKVSRDNFEIESISSHFADSINSIQ